MHKKTFTVAAAVQDVKLSVATGRNKRQAEQRAAREALTMLLSVQQGLVPPPEGLDGTWASEHKPSVNPETPGAQEP